MVGRHQNVSRRGQKRRPDPEAKRHTITRLGSLSTAFIFATMCAIASFLIAASFFGSDGSPAAARPTASSAAPSVMTTPPSAVSHSAKTPHPPRAVSTPSFGATDCSAATKPVYFANVSRSRKESKYSVGPSLVPAGLKSSAPATPAQARQVVKSLWNRLCQDDALARATLATLDSRSNLASVPHATVLKRLRAYPWERARLVYTTPPRHSWTYMAVPGYYPDGRPALLPTRAHRNYDWYMEVPNPGHTEAMFRLSRGGQGTTRWINSSVIAA